MCFFVHLILISAMAKTEIKGLKETIAAIEATGGAINADTMIRFLRAGAGPVLGKVRIAVAGYGLPIQTFDFINLPAPKNKNFAGVLMGLTKHKKAYIVRWHEYGTAPRWTKDGLFRGQMIARGDIRRIFDMSQNETVSKIQGLVLKHIKKEAERRGIGTTI